MNHVSFKRDHLDIVSIMEEWARWMHQRNFHGWPARTILGWCLDDMPTTICTTCDGQGRVPGDLVGSAQMFVKCEICKGKGKVPMTASVSKINPALISGTERFDRIPKVQFNFLAHKVDLVVQNDLTTKQKNVVYMEYQEPGPKYRKARILNIASSTYCELLNRAHHKIEKNLTIRI